MKVTRYFDEQVQRIDQADGPSASGSALSWAMADRINAFLDRDYQEADA